MLISWKHDNLFSRNNMFNLFNTTKTLTIDEKINLKYGLIEDVINLRNRSVIDKLKNVNINDSLLLDDSRQNLLHITTKMDNNYLTRELVGLGMDKYQKNIYGETPLDIAIQKHNTELIKLFIDTTNPFFKQEIDYLTSENKRLQEKNDYLEKDNRKLLDCNENLTSKYNSTIIKLSTESNTKRKLYDDLDFNEKENKKLKSEINNLKKDNKILQDTVNTLRKNNKK